MVYTVKIETETMIFHYADIQWKKQIGLQKRTPGKSYILCSRYCTDS